VNFLLENVDIFSGHLEYLADILDILWPFGTFCVHLVHFFPVLVSCIYQAKIWQPCAAGSSFLPLTFWGINSESIYFS
jgi:hypothetical protein